MSSLKENIKTTAHSAMDHFDEFNDECLELSILIDDLLQGNGVRAWCSVDLFDMGVLHVDVFVSNIGQVRDIAEDKMMEIMEGAGFSYAKKVRCDTDFRFIFQR